MRTSKVSTETIIDLLAGGKTMKEVAKETESKKFAIYRRIERLRILHNCKTITQLVVKLKLSGINTTQE